MIDALRLLVDMVDASNDETMLMRALDSFATAHGFSGFAYLHMDGVGVKTLTSYPKEWVHSYRTNRYVLVDPVLRLAKLKRQPFIWRTADWQLRSAPVDLRRFASEASDFGISGGVTIPVELSFGAHVMLTFAGMNLSQQSALVSEASKALQTVLSIYYRLQLIRADIIYQVARRLSPREVSCLKWSMKGKSAQDIAVLSNLTPRTVQYYLDSARQKVGADTLPHLVAIAKDVGIV